MIKFSRIEEIAYKRGFRIEKDGTPSHNGQKCEYTRKPNNRGYYYFTLSVKGKHKNCAFHRLQAYQKYGDMLYGDGILVRHLNGNPLDNSFDNIALGSHRDNAMDIPKDIRTRASEIGRFTMNYGGNGCKIPDSDKEKIRADHAAGMGYRRLKRKYGYSMGGIFYVCNGCRIKKAQL